MLTLGEIKLGSVISIDNQPYIVTYTQHIKVARGGATLRTKLKNLITGATLERSFSGSDKVEEADVARRHVNFLYSDADHAYFMDEENFEQYGFEGDVVDEHRKYLKEGQKADVLLHDGKPVSFELPKKIELAVTQAPPGVKGDTSGSATKTITLETGLEVRAPLFIKEGDIVRINTDSGEYLERA